MGILDAPPRRLLGLGVLGQSVERGAVSTSEILTKPQAFHSLRVDTIRAPLGPSISRAGGYWFKVFDDLYDAGWETEIANGAVGSASMIGDFAGQMKSWSASSIPFRERPSQGPADRGYSGDVVAANGGIFRCIRGNDKYTLNTGPDLTGPPGRGDGYLDTVTTMPGVREAGTVYSLTIGGAPTGGTYTIKGNGNETAAIAYNASAATVQAALRSLGGVFGTAMVNGAAPTYGITLGVPNLDTTSPVRGTNSLTGGTAPDAVVAPLTFQNYRTGGSSPFPSSGVIATMTRGTLIPETSGSATDAAALWRFEGFQDAVPPNGNGSVVAWPAVGTVMTAGMAGMGWDPLGLCQRLLEEMQRIRRVNRKLVLIANGQADVGGCSTTPGTVYTVYRDALVNVATYFLNRGCEVMLGFTSFSPAVSATLTQWDNAALSVDAAITQLQATSDGPRVHAGPNLYRLMGTTGPMASGGAFIAADGVHLNGAGCVGPAASGVQPAGKHVADAIKAIL